MPIIRLMPGVLKSAEFIAALDKRPREMERLKTFLKNETVRCYAKVNEADMPLAYVVTSFTEGADSLLCNYFQDLVPGTINRDFFMELLDHTGFDVMTVPAPSEQVMLLLDSHGFTHAETVWMGDVSTYRGFPVAKEVENISGEAYYRLSAQDVEQLRAVMSDAYFGDIRSDPLGRRPGEGNFFQDVMDRVADHRYETFIIRNANTEIIGYAQGFRLEPGTVVVQGVGVKHDYRNKRYGRKLLAAVLKHAAGLGPTIYATVFAGNETSMHLFRDVLRFKKVMPVYGLTRREATTGEVVQKHCAKGQPRPSKLMLR